MSLPVPGRFLDASSILAVTIPIVFPALPGPGHDPIWFGVVAVIVIEMGVITPRRVSTSLLPRAWHPMCRSLRSLLGAFLSRGARGRLRPPDRSPWRAAVPGSAPPCPRDACAPACGCGRR
ncbi:TRAP transporter large permease subunit [Pararhodobacter sp.]